MMDDTEEIILLSLILSKRRRKRRNYRGTRSKPDFGFEIVLPEEKSMVNFIG